MPRTIRAGEDAALLRPRTAHAASQTLFTRIKWSGDAGTRAKYNLAMSKPRDLARLPVTAAIRMLRTHDVAWTDHPYDYEERGGTAVSARELGVDEHACIKTLIMEDDARRPLVMLMHGDREVSTKNLARAMAVKSVQPCTPEVADRHSGYQVGGTSPFGTRRTLPVYLQRTIADLPYLYVNGGHRGYLVGMQPAELIRVLRPILVDAATTP